MWRSALVAIVGSAMVMAGCSRSDSNVCSTAPLLDITGTSSVSEKMEGCIHRWAYRLAPSGERARVVAEAVIAGCIDTVLAYGIENGSDFPSLKRAQTEMAQFRVIQARVGNCRAA